MFYNIKYFVQQKTKVDMDGPKQYNAKCSKTEKQMLWVYLYVEPQKA